MQQLTLVEPSVKLEARLLPLGAHEGICNLGNKTLFYQVRGDFGVLHDTVD